MTSLAARARDAAPGTPEFDAVLTDSLDLVRTLMARDPDSERLRDTYEELQRLQIVTWGPEGLTAAGGNSGQHWKDELRIPKGNGEASGQWTFTPWKHLDNLAKEVADIGVWVPVSGEAKWKADVVARLELAQQFLGTVPPPPDTDPGDPKVKHATAVVAQLLDDAAKAGESLGIGMSDFNKARKSIKEFGQYDWSLFNYDDDIGDNDPDQDFGELLTDPFGEDPGDIGAGEGPLQDWEKELLGIIEANVGPGQKMGKDIAPGDVILFLDDGPFEVDSVTPMKDPAGDKIQVESTEGYSKALDPHQLYQTEAKQAEGTKKASELQPGDVVITYDSEGDPVAVELAEVEPINATGHPEIFVTDIDGASWTYSADDEVEVLPPDDEGATPATTTVSVKDLKPGDVFTWDGGEIAVEEVAPGAGVLGDMIKITDADGLTLTLGKDTPVEVVTPTTTVAAADLKPGDAFVWLGEVITVDHVEMPDSDGAVVMEVYGVGGAKASMWSDTKVELLAPQDAPAKTTIKAGDLKPGDTVFLPNYGEVITVDHVDEMQGPNGPVVIEVVTPEGSTYPMYPTAEVEKVDQPQEGVEEVMTVAAADLKPGQTIVVPGGEHVTVEKVAPLFDDIVSVLPGAYKFPKHQPVQVVPGVQPGDAAYVNGQEVIVVDVTPEGVLVDYVNGDSDLVPLSDVSKVPSPIATPETTKAAQDVVAGDVIMVHGYPVTVAKAGVEPNGFGGPPLAMITSTGGQEYAYELLDEIPVLVSAPHPAAAAAERSDFLGLEPFTPAEKQAVKEYGTPSGYKIVNPYLNSGGQVYDSSIPGLRPAKASEKVYAAKTIKALDSAFDKAVPIDHDVVVTRKTDEAQFGPDPMAPGHVFENLSYTSTALPGGKTHGYGYENKNVEWEITLPKGTRAIQGNGHENEILLPRGSRFEVESDMTDADGVRRIKVRLVLEDAPTVAATAQAQAGGAYESPADVPIGESVLLLPVWSGGSPVKYTKDAENQWVSVDPQAGGEVVNSDADLEEAWDTLFTQEEGAPKTAGLVEVSVPITGKEIRPGDTLVLGDGKVLKKAGGVLVPSTGSNPTVAEVKVGPKWANIVTTTGQKLWVASGSPLTVKRQVEPTVTSYPTTSLMPGDALLLSGDVLKKSAGKLIPATEESQGKHDPKPVIASVKHGPKWTEVTATSGQKLWIASGTEVPAERTPGLAVPGSVGPGGDSWKGKPAPVAPPEPVEPKAGVPKPGAFDDWLMKVKARYDANPNKAKGSLEDSYSWAKVQSVMGTDPALAKTGMDSLRDGQYLDDALHAEAAKIWEDAKVLEPGAAEKYNAEYEAWTLGMKQHAELMAAWQKDNPTSLLGMDGAKAFGSNSEGVAWANKNLPKPPPHTHAMIKSMKGGSGYINGQLWNNGGQVPDSVKSEVALLDQAMSPLEHDIYLFRGTTFAEFKGISGVEDLKKAVGTTFVQHGFQPTGLGVDTAFSGNSVQIAYRAPKGTRGVWARPIEPPAFSEEREFMLGRNTRYFIHKVTQKDGKVFVEAEIIPDGHPDPSGQPPKPLTSSVGTYFASVVRW